MKGAQSEFKDNTRDQGYGLLYPGRSGPASAGQNITDRKQEGDGPMI